MEHRHFRDILHYLKKGDCLVINDTKVIRRVLMGHKVGNRCRNRSSSFKEKIRQCLETLGKAGVKDEGPAQKYPSVTDF